ncbi:MAG: serine protease, partial [Verrucomicrobiota bacterium]
QTAGANWSELEGKVQASASQLSESCVSIRSAKGNWGSGVIVSKDGLIFSAAHVFTEEGETVELFTQTGISFAGKVVKLNTKHDLAVLKVQEPFAIEKTAILAKSGSGADASMLIAAGHASGYTKKRTTPIRVGFGFEHAASGLIYSTCRITAGDSGGPLFDEDGRLQAIHHTMDGGGKFSAHVPVQRFFQLWPELQKAVIFA